MVDPLFTAAELPDDRRLSNRNPWQQYSDKELHELAAKRCNMTMAEVGYYPRRIIEHYLTNAAALAKKMKTGRPQ